MINHLRTLLLNQKRGTWGPDFPGEEYVPPKFKPLTVLPDGVSKAHKVLFGGNTDRLMGNVRLRQLLPMLHQTELEEYVLALDPRITYWPSTDQSLYRDAYTITVQAIMAMSNEDLTPVGQLLADEAAGSLFHRWRVTVQPDNLVEVRRLEPPLTSTLVAYTITNGRSNIIPLLGSTLSFTFAGAIGSSWIVEGRARPTRDAGTLMATLENSLTEVDEIEIFGVTSVEPMAAFRRLWRKHDKIAYKFGGLLLGMAYRLNAAHGG